MRMLTVSTPVAVPVAAAPALPALDVPAYMGRWHQVALYPNRFQAQCLDSTTATYKLLDDGRVEVATHCRTKDGWAETVGVARPRDGAVLQADDIGLLEQHAAGMGPIYQDGSFNMSSGPLMLRAAVRDVMQRYELPARPVERKWLSGNHSQAAGGARHFF
jgi:hypothetical protein